MTRLVIDVGRDDDGRLSGTITAVQLGPEPFDGVIELLARIEELVDGRGAEDAEPASPR